MNDYLKKLEKLCDGVSEDFPKASIENQAFVAASVTALPRLIKLARRVISDSCICNRGIKCIFCKEFEAILEGEDEKRS